MKKYIIPEMEITEFEVEDVIETSGGGAGGGADGNDGYGDI